MKTTCSAVGNDVADDTAAINTCIGLLVSGDTLLFPAGTYKTSSQLTINVTNITIDGSSNTATIHSIGGNSTLRLGTESLGSAIALSATAAELATSFTTVSSLGVVAGNYVYIKQGGQDSSTGSGNTGCDPAGCRGEIVKVLSVSGNTVTVTTALHDTYNPSVNAATAQKVNSTLVGVTMQNITLDGSAVNTHGLETRSVLESTFSGITIRNILGSAIDTEIGFNNAWSNIAITQAGSAQCGGAFFMERQGSPTITTMTLSNLNTAASACLANGSFGLSLGGGVANGTFNGITVDKTGSGTGRPAKLDAVRWSTFNNLTVTGGSGAYNGLNLEYYSSHNTFNSCVITNNLGGVGSGNAGVNMFGNFNQFNTFSNCTFSGNGNVQFLINNFDALRLGADSNNTIQASTFGGPNTGLLVNASNTCVNNNTFTAGSGLSSGISVSGTNNLGLGNVMNGFSTNLPAGVCGSPPPPPLPTNYYVSPTGAGTGLTVGSPSNFASIQTIIPATLPAAGVIVNAASGTYANSVLWTRDGDATHPIVIISTSNWGARMVNNAAVSVQIGQSNNPATYVTWGTIGHGFEITTAGPPSTAQCGGIYLWGQNVLLQGNWLHDIAAPTAGCGPGTGGAAIAVPQGGTTLANDINRNNRIDANIIDNVGAGLTTGCNNQHGIYLGSPNHTVTNNIVTHSCGEGIETYHATTGEVISNNVVMYNDDGGIQITADSAVTCNNNTTVDNNVVAFNGGRFGAFSVGGIAEAGAGCAGAANRYNNNYLLGNGGGDFLFGIGPCTLATCGSGNVIMTAPQFAGLFVNNTQNAKTGDYHLVSLGVGGGSIACAAGGLSPCVPPNDLAGAGRVTPYDIGVYKFGGGGGSPIGHVSPGSPSDFGSIAVGACSATQTFTFDNSGTASLTINAPFTISPNQTDFQIAPGGTCAVNQILAPTQFCTANAKFCPASSGAKTANYNFFSTAPNSPQVITLTGTATQPDVTLAALNGGIPAVIADIDEAPDIGVITCPEPAMTDPTDYRWRWRHDLGTAGTSCGNSSLVSTPSQGGQSREFDISGTGNGGERFSIHTNPGTEDSLSRNFVYDTYFYISALTNVKQLEFDYNQVLSNGNTVIYGTQCNLASGFWDYTVNSGGSASWVRSTIACTAGQFNLSPTANHLIVTYHRDAVGVVTYDSISLNGTVTPFVGASGNSAFGLGWVPVGAGVLNFQVNGDNTSFSLTAYLDKLNISASGGNLRFASQTINTTSAPLTAVVTSTGTGPLAITSITTAAPFSVLSDNCPRSPATMAPNQTCTVNVVITPTSTGVQSGTLTVLSTAVSGTQTLQLFGTGQSLSAPGNGIIISNGITITGGVAFNPQ